MADGEINIDNIINRLLEGKKTLKPEKSRVIALALLINVCCRFFSAREPPWQDGADERSGGSGTVPKVQGDLPAAAHPARAGSAAQNLR